MPSSEEQSHVGRSQVCRATHELRQFVCDGVQAVLVHHMTGQMRAPGKRNWHFLKIVVMPLAFASDMSFTLSWEWRRVALPLSSGVTCERKNMSADGFASQQSNDRNRMKSWNLQQGVNKYFSKVQSSKKKPEYFWPWGGHRTSSQAACGQTRHAWTAQQAQAPSPDTPAIQPKYSGEKAANCLHIEWELWNLQCNLNEFTLTGHQIFNCRSHVRAPSTSSPRLPASRRLPLRACRRCRKPSLAPDKMSRRSNMMQYVRGKETSSVSQSIITVFLLISYFLLNGS